jgi:hypothetical protein
VVEYNTSLAFNSEIKQGDQYLTLVHFNSALQMVQTRVTPGSFTRTILPISSPIPAARFALSARLRSVLLEPGIVFINPCFY